MTRDELKNRLISIKGTPRDQASSPKKVKRRDVPDIEVISEYEDSQFDDFFDFEEDLSNLESARSQIEKLEEEKIMGIGNEQDVTQETSFIEFQVEEDEVKLGDSDSFLLFEEDNLDNNNEDDKLKNILNKKISKEQEPEEEYKFRYCAAIKNNGEGCKRQAPKNSKYCSSHRKMFEKD